MLRQIEDDVRAHYYDPAFHGVDLKATVRAAAQRLNTTTGFNDAVGILSDVLIQLDDSHTTFLPPNRRVRVYSSAIGWAGPGSTPTRLTASRCMRAVRARCR